jgi:ATP-binding protein involved in chromosome partitioning
MAYFTPEELPNNKYYIFGKDGGKQLAEEYEVPLLGELPLVQSIREGGDAGLPVMLNENAPESIKEAFQQIAINAAQQIAIRNATFAPATNEVLV